MDWQSLQDLAQKLYVAGAATVLTNTDAQNQTMATSCIAAAKSFLTAWVSFTSGVPSTVSPDDVSAPVPVVVQTPPVQTPPVTTPTS